MRDFRSCRPGMTRIPGSPAGCTVRSPGCAGSSWVTSGRAPTCWLWQTRRSADHPDPVLTLTFWLAAANLGQLLLGLGRGALLARWLGQAKFGQLGHTLA